MTKAAETFWWPRKATDIQQKCEVCNNSNRPVQQVTGGVYMRNPYKKTAKSFIEQSVTLNGLPQTIRTDKSTAFAGREFRDSCKSLNKNLIYGTNTVHTYINGIGGKENQNAKRLQIWRGYNINETLRPSLNAMRTTVQSSIIQTPFERHYGRRRRTGIHIYLNVSRNKHYIVSAKPETLEGSIHKWKWTI